MDQNDIDVLAAVGQLTEKHEKHQEKVDENVTFVKDLKEEHVHT